MTKSSITNSRSKTNSHWNDCFIHGNNTDNMEYDRIGQNVAKIIQLCKNDDIYQKFPWFLEMMSKKTRPDTRPSVACGWAEAVMLKNWQKRYFYESIMDGPMDRRTDGWTHPLIESLARDKKSDCMEILGNWSSNYISGILYICTYVYTYVHIYMYIYT